MNLHGTTFLLKTCLSAQILKKKPSNIKPNFTIVSAPHFKADPEVDGTKSETFVIISFKHKTILIGGTEYAGEMKKVSSQ